VENLWRREGARSEIEREKERERKVDVRWP
jgi:hypothetical protein